MWKFSIALGVPWKSTRKLSSQTILEVSKLSYLGCMYSFTHLFVLYFCYCRTEPPNPDDENEQLASFLPHEILQEIYGKTPTSTTSTTTDTTTTTSPTGPSLPESSSSGIGIGTPSSSLAAAASRAWTAAQAIHYRTNQRVPTIYVYLMDSNHQHAKALTNLLLGDHQQSNSTQKRRNKIPVVVYRLRQNDFEPLLATSSSTSKSTTAAAAYVGMGIDRIANIVAARYLAPNASAHLVIDGGTATTYTASMPSSSQKPTTTTLCGGIGAGLRLKFRSLYDYTWNLPLIQYEHVVNIIQQAETTQTPLQVLELSIWAAAEVAADAGTEEEEMDVATTTTTTDGPVDSSSSPTTTTAVVGELVRKSIVANVLTETALLLCNVIRNWCMETQENTPSDNEKQMLPTVFITGGDGDIMEKLLRPEHSHIVKTNPANAQLLQAAHWTSNEDDDAEETPSTVAAATASSHDTAQFRIQKNSKLTHFAVQALLLSHSGFSSEAKTSSSSQSEHVEWQRELIGHRVAVPQSGTDTTTTNVRYGSILYAFLPSSSRRKKVDPNNVYFYVFYDDDNDDDSNDASRQVDHHHLSLEQIYGTYVLPGTAMVRSFCWIFFFYVMNFF
jgi:pantothenate kinase type III